MKHKIIQVALDAASQPVAIHYWPGNTQPAAGKLPI